MTGEGFIACIALGSLVSLVVPAVIPSTRESNRCSITE
jgi:hypothetical protein